MDKDTKIDPATDDFVAKVARLVEDSIAAGGDRSRLSGILVSIAAGIAATDDTAGPITEEDLEHRAAVLTAIIVVITGVVPPGELLSLQVENMSRNAGTVRPSDRIKTNMAQMFRAVRKQPLN